MNKIVALMLMALALCVAPAQAGTEKISVHGTSLEGNLEGNSADRDVFVVLPPSYAKEPNRRYPVVYFLHGFGDTAQIYLDYLKAPDATRTAFAAGAQEMILVLPDGYTRLGGSMFSNSPTVGDFETFVARDLVAHIDRHYRTLARRESRGLSGHSMGGYGTLRIGMKFPHVFSSLYAMSSCCLIPRTIPLGQAKAIDSVTLQQALKPEFDKRFDLAAAAAWSPAPNKPPLFLDSGAEGDALDPLVLAKWAANAPQAMLPQYLPALRSMTAISLDVGNEDFILADSNAMHTELNRYGITHHFEVYEGDHGNRVPERFQAKVLPFFARHLAGQTR
ncbi:alpha/beta hydrolase [Pseudoxanthomonas sp. UTMC 1351]|uniref:alpha/beta hydrolase n=1 Tax=Pseudoxanthomonas sp. UTMC 1351 TaxID=2695853 RepID=UPI0034CD9627